MKISSDEIRHSLLHAKHARPGTRAVTPYIQGSEVVRKTTLMLLSSADEIRIDQVQELQNLLAKDQYRISSDDIAEKILGRVLTDQIEL